MTPDTWGLRPLAVDDVYSLFSNPETFRHLPSAAFTERSEAVELVDRAVADWREHGLAQWAVLIGNEFVGVGGVNARDEWWNLSFRLHPLAWGRGLASWVAEVGVNAAARTEPDWPVVARSLRANPASARVSENAGLAMVHECISQHPHTRGMVRLIHADRPLNSNLVDEIVALD